MNKSNWLAASVVAGCAVLFACSTSSNGGDAGANYGSYTACITQGASSDCVTCVENNCGTPLSNIESSCTDYLNCACPGGSYDASAASSSTCEGALTNNTPCNNATDGFGACLQSNCTTECGSLDGGTDDGSSADSATSGDGGNVACGIGYASAACAGCAMSACCTQSQTCANDSACTAVINCIGACAATDTTCQNNCVSSASSTAQTEYNNVVNCLSTSCPNDQC